MPYAYVIFLLSLPSNNHFKRIEKVLRLLKHQDIDESKWTDLYERTANSIVFSDYKYLSGLCEWDAIVLNDYEGAIALPVRNKFGIKQIYQPNFIQLCPWFGTSLNDGQKTHLFKLLKTNYHQIRFNSNLKLSDACKHRINQIINLLDYQYLKGNYAKSLRKNIQKNKQNLVISRDLIPENTIELYKKAYGHLNPQLNEESYLSLKELIKNNSNKFLNAHIYSKNILIASILLAKSHSRFHYILGAPNEMGRKLNALAIGIDYIFELFADQNMIFDFEGSSIPSVNKYYASFGAKEEYFYSIDYRTPWLQTIYYFYNRWFKS